MQGTQLQDGVAIQQETDGDRDFYLPDGALGIEKLSSSALKALTGYDAIVGTSTNAAVLYTSVQAAVNAIAADGRILVLPGTYSESVTVTSRIYIKGQGFGSHITGTITAGTGCSYSTFETLQCSQFIFSSSAGGNQVIGGFWTTAPSDSGTGNNISGVTI